MKIGKVNISLGHLAELIIYLSATVGVSTLGIGLSWMLFFRHPLLTAIGVILSMCFVGFFLKFLSLILEWFNEEVLGK